MTRAVAAFLLLAALAFAATQRLYLKDGTYQLVREYKVEGDRVRYYTVERGDWEEIPADLVDLKRTKAEFEAREEARKEETAALAAEEKAEREAAREVSKVPVEPGVYLVEGDKLRTIPLAETTLVMDKKRRILQVMSPVPMIQGKGWLETKGETSKNVVANPTPEFYIRLVKEERFGLLRLKPGKDSRIIERVQVEPVSKMMQEDQDKVEVFRRQLGEGLYKIWPMKPLEPGEYAVIEWTAAEDNGINMQTWDFSVTRK